MSLSLKAQNQLANLITTIIQKNEQKNNYIYSYALQDFFNPYAMF